MVVIIQTGACQIFCLLFVQHTQGHAGFHTQRFHPLHHADHIRHIFGFRWTPRSAHTKTGCTCGFGRFGLFNDLFDCHQFFTFKAGVITGWLGTISTIFRTCTGFDWAKSADLNFIRVEVAAMNCLRLKEQVIEG